MTTGKMWLHVIALLSPIVVGMSGFPMILPGIVLYALWIAVKCFTHDPMAQAVKEYEETGRWK